MMKFHSVFLVEEYSIHVHPPQLLYPFICGWIGFSTWLQITRFHPFLWLKNIPFWMNIAVSSSLHQRMKRPLCCRSAGVYWRSTLDPVCLRHQHRLQNSKNCCLFLPLEASSQRGTCQMPARDLLCEVSVDLYWEVSPSQEVWKSENHLRRARVLWWEISCSLQSQQTEMPCPERRNLERQSGYSSFTKL
ncbi:uncharacterized protein LOC115900399 isoform X3 [Rhinopithecus roxellana]|uniref:uncharacterized protein LOC115900399 isoform X3 n=1 Tax=Rhinopithecus roxellana TaxID=61622 RepID=UPI0012375C30|nr:uncharacterized protein LOC115900399 isoform X3 [Rhinopithecus roxellana]